MADLVDCRLGHLSRLVQYAIGFCFIYTVHTHKAQTTSLVSLFAWLEWHGKATLAEGTTLSTIWADKVYDSTYKQLNLNIDRFACPEEACADQLTLFVHILDTG